MFNTAKDRMTSAAAKAYLESRMKDYGRIEELTIDSSRQRIELEIQLDGEVAPISITIARYHVEQKDGQAFVEVLESSASRPWLEAVMRDHLHGRKFPLPAWVVAAL
ncbi:MAG: hypothetical protein EXS37_03795 [Opitutus sp.]|nr:hypothetical protein [Opitutus sp.]